MASMKQPTIEERLLSPMSIRVDANAKCALQVVDLIFAAIGGIDAKTTAWTVSCTITHPAGVHVKMKVVAYLVHGDQTHLDIQRGSGDALFGGKVFRLLLDALVAFKVPSCVQHGHDVLPSPPPGLRLQPSKDPKREVPSLCLSDAARDDVAWSTVDGIAAWSPADIHHFKVEHDNVTVKFQQGRLAPGVFAAHFQNMPACVRRGLKPALSWKDCLPRNCADVLDKMTMLIAEGEMYHTLHS